MLKIRQSYHGSGGREGYKYKVYDDNGKLLGELRDIPSHCGIGDTVIINGEFYIIDKEYDSENSRHENTEVVFYELEPYVFQPNFDLGEILKNK